MERRRGDRRGGITLENMIMGGRKTLPVESKRGIVFDIQRYSLHDGPGLRTNLFLKGCNLACQWCSNPESHLNIPEIAFFDRNCFYCGDCIPACPTGAIQMQGNQIIWDRSRCKQCFSCAKVCPAHAFSIIGKEMSADEVIADVIRDIPFYGNQGGLTLTGGEPVLQAEFIEEVLLIAREKGLHTILETCGAVPWEILEKLLPFFNLVLFDLKHLDPEIHRQFTGKDNILILDNLLRISKSEVGLIVRVPLIPGFNADQTSLKAIAQFLQTLKRVNEIHLLPYHTLGRAKYRAIGVPYPFDHYLPMTQEEAEKWANLFRAEGFTVVVGG